LVLVLAVAMSLPAQAVTGSATITATSATFTDVDVTDSTIIFSNLDLSGAGDDETVGVDECRIFDSENEATTADDSIAFTEGATNANAFYYVTYTGETYLGLDNTNWLFLKDTANTLDTYGYYVESQVTDTLTFGGGGVTMPGGVNEIGSYTDTLIYYSSADGDIWTRATKTIYVALGDDANLYVDDDSDLTDAETIDEKGDEVSNAFQGNKFVLTSDFPAGAGDIATFDFGWYAAWDGIPGNADHSFYALLDMPKHAAAGHIWDWDITVHGEYHSRP